MAFVREYIFSVTGAALVSGVILRLLAGKGSAAVLGKMLVGIFMALTVLNPIANVTLPDLMDVVPDLSADAQAVVAQGETATQNALAAGISKQVEAYILDRAEELGLSLQVQVELSKDRIPMPVSVRLRGNASPYAKSKLQNLIHKELGIDKEHQIWT